MTKSLRKLHLQLWLALAVLLPAGIIAGRLAIPVPVTNMLLQPAATVALPVIVSTVEKENYSIRIRKSNDSTFQLEWLNKKALTFPSATIYEVTAATTDVKKGLLIGRIEAMGDYRFAIPFARQPINLSGFQFILYDFIHEAIIDTIHFNTAK